MSRVAALSPVGCPTVGSYVTPETLAKVPAFSGEARQCGIPSKEMGPPTSSSPSRREVGADSQLAAVPAALYGCAPPRAGHATPTLCMGGGTGLLPLKMPRPESQRVRGGRRARGTPRGATQVVARISLLHAGGHRPWRGLQRQHGFHWRPGPPHGRRRVPSGLQVRVLASPRGALREQSRIPRRAPAPVDFTVLL